jgi:hypothetical protein
LHYVPWFRRLHRLAAYALGGGAILLGQFAWLGWGETFWRLAAFPLIGGAVVALSYAVDKYQNMRLQLDDGRD